VSHDIAALKRIIAEMALDAATARAEIDVTEIDPNPESDPPVLGHPGLAIDHRPLHLGRTADRADDAREFHEHPVAGGLHDAAGMVTDLRVDKLAAMRLEPLVRAFLVRFSPVHYLVEKLKD
jgi:hypothetical protein